MYYCSSRNAFYVGQHDRNFALLVTKNKLDGLIGITGSHEETLNQHIVRTIGAAHIAQPMSLRIE